MYIHTYVSTQMICERMGFNGTTVKMQLALKKEKNSIKGESNNFRFSSQLKFCTKSKQQKSINLI